MTCTTISPKTGNFFDLSGLMNQEWVIPGLDYKHNFTMSFCGPLVPHKDNPTKYSDLEEDDLSQGSVSIKYTDEETHKTYSLGKSDSHPFFRGRELVLEYHGGSFCRDADGQVTSLRRSSVVNFKCDHEMIHHVISPALVGQLSDCAYFFEVKTPHACAVSNQEQSMQPVTIFLFIVGVTGIVGTISHYLGQRRLNLGGAKLHKLALLVWMGFLRTIMIPYRLWSGRRRAGVHVV